MDLSVVVPMYNAEQSCGNFFRRILPVRESLELEFVIICIDDGSRDGTRRLLEEIRAGDPRIKLLFLSRNFGKEAALTAGIDFAAGRTVSPIDADLQDPPELIRDIVARWRDGARVVLARRTDRASDSLAKRLTARSFYAVFSRLARPEIPQNVGDFRLLDRAVVDALRRLPERNRFMKGLFAWVGFEAETINYSRPNRTDGLSKFNYWKLWNFALHGIFSFSSAPLKIWSYFGIALSVVAVLYMFWIVGKTLVLGVQLPGYASLMSVLLFFSGINLVGLGVLGEYVSRVFHEVKGRPIYIVERAAGWPDGASAPLGGWPRQGTDRAHPDPVP